MGIRNFFNRSLLSGGHLQQSIRRPMATCRIMPLKPEKKKCDEPEVLKPKYFKKRLPCKSDEELKTERCLGVYTRCTPKFNPPCLHPCYHYPRLDEKMYRPSKSLDKPYKQYWVDCIIERLPSRCCSVELKELARRKRRPPICKQPVIKGCFTSKPMKCRPLTPAPPTSDERCITNPLCECPVARRIKSCKLPSRKSKCRRQLTRYPSFSECQHDELTTKRICECSKEGSICEMIRLFQRRHRRN